MVLTVLKQGHIFALFSLSDGSEIAGSTLMEILLMNDFKLVINKVTYDVRCPKKGKKHSCATLFVCPVSYGAHMGRSLVLIFPNNRKTKKALEKHVKLF